MKKAPEGHGARMEPDCEERVWGWSAATGAVVRERDDKPTRLCGL